LIARILRHYPNDQIPPHCRHPSRQKGLRLQRGALSLHHLDSRLQHQKKMVRLLEDLTGEITTKQVELAEKKSGFQIEPLQQSRQDKELLIAGVATLRLALLQTIGARVAFFDEPTSNLDAARRENLAHAFRAIDVGREEVTEHWYDQLFLVSHDVAFTEITDKVIEL
jgi:ABC-type uncharacterized transport system YnjBCD ATPase subunit